MPMPSEMVVPDRLRARTRAGGLHGVRRLLRHRLVIPMLRSRHPPEFTARGVAFGVFWGLTPTVGVQSFLLLGVWGALRAVGWQSSLVQTVAWTWVNNPLTMVPLYYLFYVTGQVMLGNGSDAAGYAAFTHVWSTATDDAASVVDSVRTAIAVLGWPTLLGCVPWSVAGALAAYSLSLRLLRRRDGAGRPSGGTPRGDALTRVARHR